MIFSPFPSFLRSSPMRLYDLPVPHESAFNIINSLGELDLLHFIDSSPDTPQYSRHYSKYIKRIDELLLKIDDLKDIMKKFEKAPTVPKDIKAFLGDLRVFLKARNKPENSFIDVVEDEIGETIEKLKSQVSLYEDFTEKANRIHEKKVALLRGKKQLGNNRAPRNDEEARIGADYTLYYWVGLINKEDTVRFKRMVFRACKGNVFVFSEDLNRDENLLDPKTVFNFK